MNLDDEIIGAAGRMIRLAVNAAAVVGSASGGPSSALVRSIDGPGNHSTNTTVSFGSGSYTFSWANIAQITGANQSAQNAGAQNPVFQATVVSGVQSRATWRVTATDLANGLQASTDVDCRLDYSQIVGALAVSANDVIGSCARINAGSCLATTGLSIASVTGGVGPFSYLWTYVSGVTANILTPTAVSTRFSRGGSVGSSSDPTNRLEGTYRVTVTDAGTGQQASADVIVTTQHTLTV